MASGLTPSARALALRWVLHVLDEAAPRYPDLAAVAARARSTEGSLDRFIDAVDKIAAEQGKDQMWKSMIFPRVVSTWMSRAGTAARELRADAEQRLDERRSEIVKATEQLLKLLRSNDAQVPREIGIELRALPVSVRFPYLISSLTELSDWAHRVDAKPSIVSGRPKKAALFVQEVDAALGFQLPNEVVADLWRLLEQSEISSNAVRMARERTNHT